MDSQNPIYTPEIWPSVRKIMIIVKFGTNRLFWERKNAFHEISPATYLKWENGRFIFGFVWALCQIWKLKKFSKSAPSARYGAQCRAQFIDGRKPPGQVAEYETNPILPLGHIFSENLYPIASLRN